MLIDYFESAFPVYWQWPVHVGYLPNADIVDSLTAITERSWFTKFSYLLKLDHSRTQCNILLLKGELPTLIQHIAELPFAIRADVVLVFSHSTKEISKIGLDVLAHYTSSNGVAIVTELDHLVNWLEQLSVHLSHNENIVEAIQYTGSVAYLYISHLLAKQTTLKGFTEGLLNRLQTSDNKGIPKDIVDDISRHLSNCTFERESGDASTINDAIQEIEKNIPSSIIRGGNWEYLPIEKSIVPESVSAELVVSRFLQCRINHTATPQQPITDFLRYNESYQIAVRIGPSSETWLQGNRNKPVKTSFKNRSKEYDIQIQVSSNLSDAIDKETISLPQGGESSTAFFTISTADKTIGDKLFATISAHYQGGKFQEIILTAHIVDSTITTANLSPIYIETTTNLRVEFGNLDQRSTFAASITVDDEKAIIDTPKITGRLSDLGDSLMIVRSFIETIVRSSDEVSTDLFHEKNQLALHNIALHGSVLYKSEFKDIDQFPGAIQIIANTKKFIPLEFIYTLPPPQLNATLCPNAKEALKNGKCSGCIDSTQSPAPYICPFGFLCMDRIIERHDISRQKDWLDEDFAMYAAPTSSRDTIPVLNRAILGASDRVDQVDATVVASIKEKVNGTTASFGQADSWEQWQNLIKEQHPSSLILVVHSENHEIIKMPQLEIGEKHFLLQAHLNKTHIVADKPAHPPLVFLLGCRTQNNDSDIYDFSRAFKQRGAAIVLSNFTKITGRQAGKIVIQLFQFFEKHKGEKLRLGKIMLSLRQHLLSEGLIASLSLVAHGDADWFIQL